MPFEDFDTNAVGTMNLLEAAAATRSAYRLHQGLQRIGCSSTMFAMEKTCADQSIVRFEPPQGIMDRVGNRIRREAIARDFAQCRASLETRIGKDPSLVQR